MSGPFGSSQWMYSSGGFYPYEIEQSLRFNDNDSAYLSRTPASAGNRKTWTWSGWVKRGNLGTQMILMGATITAGSSEEQLTFGFPLTNGLAYRDGVSGNFTVTSAEFRDPSAWYHIVFAYNSTATTQADRGIFYVNGVRQATTTDAIALNKDAYINNTTAHGLGRYGTIASTYFDGYMAEVNFIDGQALDPTSFGEFKSGVWIPKKYTGSYGTNGFYLSFADSAAIGDDLSGNGNDWTPSGLASTDVLLDSPTNNYAVSNVIDIDRANITTSDGNLLVVKATASNSPRAASSIGVKSGKYYAEVTWVSITDSAPNYNIISTGVTTKEGWSATNNGVNAVAYAAGNSVAASENGDRVTLTDGVFSGFQPYGTGYWVNGSVIGIALDLDAGEVTFYNNGVSQGALTLPATDEPWFFFCTSDGSSNGYTNRWNFGQSPFAYTPPADFLPLCTANLPEPTITPALDDVPADYFNTVLYTGTGATQSITGVGFQPDFVWGKSRSAARSHNLYDAVRGAGNMLVSEVTNAEFSGGELTSFDADGFSLGAAVYQMNQSGDSMVAWNWKAAGAGVANTDGTISSTVSANQKAGFSVVSWAGTSSVGTVGHGLGAAPDLIITRPYSTTGNWFVWHRSVTSGNGKYLYLNLTAGLSGPAGTPVWDATDTTTQSSSSVFDIGANTAANGSGQDHIAYCFAEVEGYSKFGSYTGNGSTDGVFVYCGFRPAFVLVKRTDAADDWVILDNERDPYNLSRKALFPNSSSSETANGFYDSDILSNGIKLRSSNVVVNASGGTYIFAAFAEQPVKYSLAR